MNKDSPLTLTNGLALIVILGFFAVIGASLWLSGQSRHAFGPTLLATDAEGVITNIGHTLYRLDSAGNIEFRLPVAELGIPELPLTDSLILPDGSLLVGVAGGRHLYRCRLQERRCTPFLQGDTGPAGAHKMTWDAARQRLIVIDGKRHRILSYDADGGFLEESRGGEKGLVYPNTPHLTPQDELVIADTNQHRLVALDPETLGGERWEMPVENDLGNFRRIWPTDFILTPGGSWWVILDDDLLANGDVILFDEQRRPYRRLDLPADWDPVKLRLHGDDVLLAGHGSVDLVSATTDGALLSPFGDRAFREDLATVRAQRQSSQRWWDLWIWVCIIPLALLAAVAAWLDYRQRRTVQQAQLDAGAATPAPLPVSADGVQWLEHNPVVVRQWKMARWAVYLLPALMSLPVILMIAMFGLEKSTYLIGLVLLFMVPLTVWMILSFRIITSGRLGVTADRLVLASGEDRPQHASPGRLVYSRSFISNGETTVYTRTAKAPIFTDDDIRHHVQPLLDSAKKVNALQGFIYLLRAGDRYAWMNTLGLAYMIGLIIYIEFFTAT